jgi:hypothetical protein
MRGDSPRRPAGARPAGARTAGARPAGARPASRARLNSRRGLLSPCLVVVSKRQQATWWWPCRSSLRPVQCGPFSFRGGGGLQGRPADTGRPASARSCRPPTRDPLPTDSLPATRRYAGAPRGRQTPPDASRRLQTPPEAARRLQTPPEAARGRQRPPEAARRPQRPPEARRGRQRPAEAARGPQRPQTRASEGGGSPLPAPRAYTNSASVSIVFVASMLQ